MKKIISLIISASIFLQIVVPGVSLVTYAAPGDGVYEFQWESGKVLDPRLNGPITETTSETALMSWDVSKDTSNPYTLEYFIERADGEKEKIRFKFQQKLGTETDATATIEVLTAEGDSKPETYSEYNFAKINTTDEWIVTTGSVKGIEIGIDSKNPFPGGRVKVGDLEMRFRWKDGKVHFQTNQIKPGYITPFLFKYGENVGKETISVLTGVEGYKVSPIHIEIKADGTIGNKEKIEVPGTEIPAEIPGSKPGIKVEFKGLKHWKGNNFVDLDPIEAADIGATLVLEDLTGKAKITLGFNMDNDSNIKVLEDPKAGKLSYDLGSKTYSIYLAKDKVVDSDPYKIIEWKELEESMVFTTVQLNLREISTNKSLGIFKPKADKKGMNTYLGYTVKRANVAEAFIEIQPHDGAKGTNYTYLVRTSTDGADGPGWVDLAVHEYVTIGGGEERAFTVPVSFASGGQYYQVIAKVGDIEMKSQVLHYNPSQDDSIPPPTPVIQSIDNIYVVPAKKIGDPPETIGYDLTWTAPKNTTKDKLLEKLLEKGVIYYELFFHPDLESTEGEGGGSLSKVFEVSADGNNIVVKAHEGTAGNKPQVEGIYNPSKNTFTMENIVLKNKGKENWEQVEMVDPLVKDSYHEGTNYPLVKANDNMPKRDVPGIYYVTMRALYDLDKPGVKMGVSNTSNPKSITISPLEEVVPVPTKIESKNLPDETDKNGLKIVSQSFSWGNIDLDRYIQQMLKPLDLKIGEEGKGVYEIYLYQKKNIAESELLKIEPVIENLQVDKAYTLNSDDVDVLRDDGVIRLDYKGSSSTGMNSIVLKGLDTNQVYYATIRVRLDIEEADGRPVKPPRYSVFSKEHSFTTSVDPSEPGPGERVPPVPENLQIIDQPNNTTTIIGWEAPEYTQQDGERLYYEMIRVDSRVLAKEENSRLFSIPKLLGDDTKDEMAGWRTKDPLIQKYEKTTKTWLNAIPDQASTKLELEDPGLNPNNLYYYYVRTVLEVEGEEMHSSWVGLPVTTDPIQKPIQLKVEDKRDYFHDPKREIVVSFLAPIPKGASIPTDYAFDIAVQGEMDDEYKLNYSKTRLTSTLDDKDIPTGYSHYIYKINNLKPGKRYDIKVRIIDNLVDMVGGQPPKSLYSDRVTTRTEFDQDEQDKDDKFEEYLKYFEDKVEALRRRPYWTLKDGANSFEVKYRSQYINPEINSTKAYELDVREGVSNFTYHMPANVIESANLNQTSFEIKQGDVTYSVRPSTITTELEEIRTAIGDINGKYISDYYVAFNFSQRKSTTRTGLLTPEITVDIELVRLRQEDRLLDDDIMIALNNRINSEKVRFIDDLERLLKAGRILDEDLEVLINRSLESIQASHQRDTSSIINRSIHRMISVSNWNKSMLIMAGVEGNAVAEGYLLGLTDTALTTFNVGGGFGIEVSHAGIYAFKGQKINMPVIPGVGGAGDLIGKYQLTDFFGVDGNIDPSRPVSKRNVLGAMARVLGAPRGADYIQYLKQMNIKGVTNLGMDSQIKKGEGIYLLMQVYEKTHRKPINSVHIKNRNVVSNIRSFNQLHQPYVLVAVDSKIVSKGAIGPNDAMQIKDVLQILSNIMATIR